jgi:uncharacterized protein
MNLRTITIGIPLTQLTYVEEAEPKVRKLIDDAKTICAEKQIQIRTLRINLSPVKEENQQINKQQIIGKIEAASEICKRLDIRWFNVPFDLTQAHGNSATEMTEIALEVVKRFPKAFVNLIVASNNKIDWEAIRIASKFIKDVSRLDNSGYNNFRVGVSCNTRQNTPFFPFSHSSDEMGFSVGLELTQEFTKILDSEPKSFIETREQLITRLVPDLQELNTIFTNIESQSGVKYHGIDVSLAPYPEKGSSVAELIEMLGLEQQGSNGTLFITAYLTDILKTLIQKSGIRTAGFNGVMFSLLEDEFMGKRNNNNIYSIDSLISYSAVCGCGLDMVPLPGDIFEEELASIILDVAALSSKLEKPLGVRVLPIPMKQANEFTEFNMDFLFNTRIKTIKNLSFFNNSGHRKPFSFLQEKN